MTMPSIYRVSRSGQQPITDVDTVEAVEAVVRARGPGRYDVDEHSLDPFPGTHVFAVAVYDPSPGQPDRRRPDSLAIITDVPNDREPGCSMDPALVREGERSRYPPQWPAHGARTPGRCVHATLGHATSSARPHSRTSPPAEQRRCTR